MFYNCSSLTEIPLINTCNATDMAGMFSGCKSLTTIPLLNTINVTSTSQMFKGCESLISIPAINTSFVMDMTEMFAGCKQLVEVPTLDTSKSISLEDTFKGCIKLTNKQKGYIRLKSNKDVRDSVRKRILNNSLDKLIIDFNGPYMTSSNTKIFSPKQREISFPIEISKDVTNINGLFANCAIITSIPTFDTAHIEDMSYLFAECTTLTDAIESCEGMFLNCAKLETQPSYKIPKDANSVYMYEGCSFTSKSEPENYSTDNDSKDNQKSFLNKIMFWKK